MKITRMAATFGALKGAGLEFQPGLNIIQSPNEAGKSTWCAFIRAMLYGINTAERNKEGVLAEKTKYRPWSGGAMEGRMEVETEDGQAITIQRTALGPSPMKRLDVRYTGTGEEVLRLMHENLGESLTGVPEAVFVRSAFIRQADVKVTQTGPLEERIKSLISSGEEEVNYGQATKKLGEWLRRRRHNKTGQIPETEAELLEVNHTLARLQEASAVYHELSIALDKAKHQTETLAKEWAIHIEMERRAQRQKIADQRQKVQELQTEIAGLRKKLTQADGKPISGELVREAKAVYDQLTVTSMRYTTAKETWEQAEKDMLLVEEEKANTPFAGKDMETAKTLVDQAAAVDAAAVKAAGYNKSVYGVPLAALPVTALAALTVMQMTGLALWPVFAVSVVGAVLAGLLFYRKWRVAKRKEVKRAKLFASLDVPDMEALQTAFVEYEFLSQKAEELRRTFQETDQAAGRAMLEMQEFRDKFETDAHAFAPEAQGLEEAFLTLTEIGRTIERLGEAGKELETAQIWQETLEAGYEGNDPHAPIPRDGLTLPDRGKNEIGHLLRQMEQELDVLKHRFALGQGEVRALGDPVVLGARRGALVDRLTELTRQYQALQLAMEVLGEADSEISARFSPLLGQRAGYYLDRLTGGAYKRVVFDKALVPSVEQGDESVSRDVLYLSGGTVDQVYLALRLAICDLTFPKEQACPIILDDALVSFDEGRMEQALKLFKELAAERQVLLFTCHRREAAFFDGVEGVNMVQA